MKRRPSLTAAQRRFAAVELAPAQIHHPPLCDRCGDHKFIITADDVDACPDCGRRAEAEWRDASS